MDCAYTALAGIFRDSHVFAFLEKVVVVRNAPVLVTSACSVKLASVARSEAVLHLAAQYHNWLTTTITNFIDPNELVSQAEAARIRGVSKQAVANLITRGRLKTVTVAGRILLSRSEVESFEALPKTGRPPKKAAKKSAKKKS